MRVGPPAAKLVVSSALMLFLELALISWLGQNIVYLSYYTNFILIASFLGIGIGFLWSRKRTALLPWTAPFLALLVGFVLIFPVKINLIQNSLILVGQHVAGTPAWVVLPCVFLAAAIVMATVGDTAARYFKEYPPLDAYRLDIIGSLIGTAVFTGLSFLWAPPLAWGCIVAAGVLYLLLPNLKLLPAVGLIVLVILLGRQSFLPGLSWSPYYMVDVGTVPASTSGSVTLGQTAIESVNGVPVESIQSVAAVEKYGPTAYTDPYAQMRIAPKNVLIIGAGDGKDVALALAHGAQHVDAVEIDPRILQVGEDLNPNHPYQNPRVTTYVNDGRAFLESTTRTYNLIILAQTDSVTVVSGQSSLRLESYLFTEQAIQAAKAHLAPGGVFVTYNYYWEQWYVNRLANTMSTVFHQPVCLDVEVHAGALEELATSLSASSLHCSAVWTAPHDAPPPVTDNYPFPYLEYPGIPPVYLLVIGGILLIALIAVLGLGGPVSEMLQYPDLFFMGAAFLLLETKNIVQFALLFGTTWAVNAYVIFGVLVSVLVAVEISRRWAIRRLPVLYCLLFIALLVSWVIPMDSLLGYSFWVRLAIAILVEFAPITIANIIFAQRFRLVGSSVPAFATNLLGAIVGGTLEYLSMIMGFQNLTIVVAAIYLLALITGHRFLRSVA